MLIILYKVNFENMVTEKDITREMNYKQVLYTIITTIMVKVDKNTEIYTFFIFKKKKNKKIKKIQTYSWTNITTNRID